MRKVSLPRIIKINKIEGLTISVVFNNGEYKLIDIKKIFNELKICKNHPALVLLDEKQLKKVELENHTLSWRNVKQFITLKNQDRVQVPFEIGADVLYKLSEPDATQLSVKIGTSLRNARKKAGLTQEALAKRSGTTRHYISRIENDKSDIELGTFRKIVETGLGKQLEIKIK